MNYQQKKNVVILLIVSAVLFSLVKHMNKSDYHEFDLINNSELSNIEYRQAVKIWERMLLKDPQNLELLEKIGQAFLKLADFTKARKYFEKALIIVPNSINIHLELIRIDILTGDLVGAENKCRILKEKIPNDEDINSTYGDVMLLFNEFDKAEDCYRKAHLVNPGSPHHILKIATCLLARGKKNEALSFFNMVEQMKISSSRVLVQIAEFFTLSTDYDLAEEYLIQAVESEPGNIGLKIKLVQFYFFTNNLERAEQILSPLITKDSDSIYLQKILADVYISLNHLENARKLLMDIKKSARADDPEYNLLQGKFWLFSGNPVYAVSHIKSALDVIPGFVSGRYYLSVAYLAAGQKQLAENSLTKTLLYDQNHTDASLLMAVMLYKKNMYDLSLEYLNRVVKNEPENFRVYMLKGLNYISLEKFDQAVIEFLQAYAIAPETAPPLYYLGLCSQYLGRPGEALEYFEQVLKRIPGLADVSYRYTMLLIKTGKARQAEEYILETIKKQPDNLYLQYIAAQVALKNSKVQEAVEFLIAGTSKPGCPAYFFLQLAQIYEDQKADAKALETLTKCVEILPYTSEAWVKLAHFHLNYGKKEDAIKVLEKAEKKLQADPDILSNLAWLYLETDTNIDMALEYARAAYEKMPGNKAFADTLGWAYFKKGALTQASWILSEIEQDDPENGWVLYHLGMTLYKEGKLSGARDKLFRAAKTNLPQTEIEQITQLLVRLDQNDISENKNNYVEENNLFDINSILSSPGNQEEDSDILEPQWQQKRTMSSGIKKNLSK